MSTQVSIAPFQGLISWLCLNGEGRYRLALGSHPFRAMMGSPEGATYPNDGYSPSDRPIQITSPERA